MPDACEIENRLGDPVTKPTDTRIMIVESPAYPNVLKLVRGSRVSLLPFPIVAKMGTVINLLAWYNSPSLMLWGLKMGLMMS